MTVEPRHRDRGTGTIASAGAVLVFLVLMLCAVQVMYDLYATSMVTAVAHDAAREVAAFDASPDRCGSIPEAERRFFDALGDYAWRAHATLRWTCADPAVVRVRVTAEHPTLLPDRFAGLLPLARVDRTIEVRVEARR